MAKKLVATTRTYIYLAPLLLLLGLGILSRTARKVVTEPKSEAPGCTAFDLSGDSNPLASIGTFENNSVQVPQELLAQSDDETAVLGVATPSDRWIEVDISDQKLKAWDGNELFLETSISSGLARTPTPKGEFRVWMKIRATKMEGGEGAYYYNLPNVPYVMFFENKGTPGYLGYGLHGTYWHNDFGTQRSHGCVNLPTTIAKELYNWTTPILPEGKNVIRADESNPGTRIVIHE